MYDERALSLELHLALNSSFRTALILIFSLLSFFIRIGDQSLVRAFSSFFPEKRNYQASKLDGKVSRAPPIPARPDSLLSKPQDCGPSVVLAT